MRTVSVDLEFSFRLCVLLKLVMISRWLEIGKKRVSAGKNEQVLIEKRVRDDRCNAQNASDASMSQ